MNWLTDVEEMVGQGGLTAVSRLLDGYRAIFLRQSRELMTGSRSLCVRGRLDDVRKLVPRARHVDFSSVGALLEHTRFAVRQGDDSGADGCFQRAWDTGARGRDLTVDWIDVLPRRGCHDEARNIAIARFERAPYDQKIWFWLGLALQQSRHYLQALDVYYHAPRHDTSRAMLRNTKDPARAAQVAVQVARSVRRPAFLDDVELLIETARHAPNRCDYGVVSKRQINLAQSVEPRADIAGRHELATKMGLARQVIELILVLAAPLLIAAFAGRTSDSRDGAIVVDHTTQETNREGWAQ